MTLLIPRCPHCEADPGPLPGLPRPTPLGGRRASIAPARLPCQACHESIETRAQEWVDMSSLSRLSVWLEYFFYAGIIIGQVLAFAVGFAVSLIESSDEFQMVPALIAWAVWLLFVGLFVRRGIRDSERRKPDPNPAS